MSGTFDRRPEYLILIAVLVALVVGIIGAVASCGIVASAAGGAAQQLEGRYGHGLDDIDELLEDIDPDDGELDESYTEEDVPASMDIDVPELQDDLQALINYDLENGMKLSGKDVEVTELTKEDVGTPELKNGQVLSRVKGKATIKNADGDTGTVDYTSYYYADDPTASKITWYIYAYDLGSYDLLPEGFKDKSGDPLGIRDYLQTGDSSEAAKTQLGKDQGKDAKSA